MNNFTKAQRKEVIAKASFKSTEGLSMDMFPQGIRDIASQVMTKFSSRKVSPGIDVNVKPEGNVPVTAGSIGIILDIMQVPYTIEKVEEQHSRLCAVNGNKVVTVDVKMVK